MWLERACISDTVELLHRLPIQWDFFEGGFVVEVHPECIDIYLCRGYSVVNHQILSAIQSNPVIWFMFYADESNGGITKFCFKKKYLGGDYLRFIQQSYV